jgi:hypothetical protein
MKTPTAVLTLFLLSTPEAHAQHRRAPELPAADAAAIMTSLRLTGSTGTAVRALRNVDRSESDIVRDEIADSLVAFIIAAEGDTTQLAAASNALAALGLAGRREGAGTPYPHSAARLMQIAESAPSQAGGALYAVSQGANSHDAVDRLSGHAASERRSASTAVRMLNVHMGQEGAAALRSLHERRVVKDPEARKQVEALARLRGWDRSIAPVRKRSPE